VNGPILVGSIVLIWAGIAKVLRPGDTARALAAAHLPASSALVRAIAGVEVVVGAGAALGGGRPFDGAMAASYGLLAAFVGVAMARGWSLSSCGCFGEADARPTIAHVAVNAVLGGAAAVAAVRGVRPPAALAHHPGQAMALAAVSAVTAGLIVLTLTRLPRLQTVVASR